MALKSRRILVQMGGLLAVALLAVLVTLASHIDAVTGALLGDPRPLVLNGIIVALFGLGLVRLYAGFRHYERQERQVEHFLRRRAEGASCAEALPPPDEPSLLRERWEAIAELHARGGPVDHGALSAITVAGESLQQAFPRFVNNVLILTGVFGTVSSLIFALVGAGDVLQAAAPDAGMGLLLLGMNTALTTTATAIVCYFFFTFFFHRFTDLQTWLLGRVERAVLLHMVPDFSFETETVNRQAKLLLEDVRGLVAEVRAGLDGIEGAVARQGDAGRDVAARLEALTAAQAERGRQGEATLERLAGLERTLVEGFRLER